ncbi:MAG TPA: hypothetical protein DCQ56_01035 [Porphyromonadaceae bacterium]|nr:hypothetical protein [Porphyromonadaceae bacterium]
MNFDPKLQYFSQTHKYPHDNPLCCRVIAERTNKMERLILKWLRQHWQPIHLPWRQLKSDWIVDGERGFEPGRNLILARSARHLVLRFCGIVFVM